MSKRRRTILPENFVPTSFSKGQTLHYPERAVAKPVPTTLKDTFSDFSEADRDHGVVLAPISQDEYEVRQGARIVGVVSFYNSRTAWGWRFFPRLHGMRPSIKLHPNPEACLTGCGKSQSAVLPAQFVPFFT